MRRISLLILLLFSAMNVLAQAPVNDDYTGAIVIDALGQCSDPGAYTTINATEGTFGSANGWNGSTGADVWFRFTALRSDITVSVYGGNIRGNGTLLNPLVALYRNIRPSPGNPSQILSEPVAGTLTSNASQSIYFKDQLQIGSTYYIRVIGGGKGTFKLCVNNYTPIAQAGEDCSTASVLCSKESFTQRRVLGSGLNNREAAGTCLDNSNANDPIEKNNVWYRWVANNNGTLTFTITPISEGDDIDWVLYDLGSGYDCAKLGAATAIRCAAGSGVDCTPFYNKTGLSMTATDLSEGGGCDDGQDGFVKYVDMIEGHHYALLINNFSNENNGFTVEFGGSGDFLGPNAGFGYELKKPCMPDQTMYIIAGSNGPGTLKWNFGEGSSPSTATGKGPFNIRYATEGPKVVTLTATAPNGCTVVNSQEFFWGTKPATPQASILNNQSQFCLGETVQLHASTISNATYTWSGPNGFSATGQNANVLLNQYSQAGEYTVTVRVSTCESEAAHVTIPPIGPTPVIDFDIVPSDLCDPFLRRYTIVNRSHGYESIEWEFPDAGHRSQEIDGSFFVRYVQPGRKPVRVTAKGSSGCTVVRETFIDVPNVPPKPTLSKNQDRYCTGDEIVIRPTFASNAGNVTYAWTGPGNYTSASAEIRIPAASAAQAGEYRLVVSRDNCSTDPVSIVVPPITVKPTAAFSTTPPMPAKLGTPITVKFKNESTNADGYIWDFGDGSTSTEANPAHTYTQKGDFQVKLVATREGYCKTEIARGTFVVREGNTALVPNTFTPNGDGVNDELVITITNLNSYHLQIFNRYGAKIFETRSIFDNWKGLANNSPAPAGVYFYLIEGVNADGSPVRQSGSVALIR